MADVSNQAEQHARRADNSEWLDRGVKVGLVAYGIVHLTIAWLAIQLAFGHGGKNASRNGALHTLAQQPFGKFVVWVVAIGMLMMVLWKLLEAYIDFNDEDGAKKFTKAGVNVAKAIVYGTLGVSAMHTALGSSSKSSTGSTTAKVMDQPFGRILIGVIGLVIIGYGCFLAYSGWQEKFLKHLDAQGQSGDQGKAYRMFGKVGYIAKGVALAVIGVLFLYAAISHKAKKSGGLDAALHTVVQQSYGPVLLFLIAVGIACYGLFCFARARHLSAQR